MPWVITLLFCVDSTFSRGFGVMGILGIGWWCGIGRTSVRPYVLYTYVMDLMAPNRFRSCSGRRYEKVMPTASASSLQFGCLAGAALVGGKEGGGAGGGGAFRGKFVCVTHGCQRLLCQYRPRVFVGDGAGGGAGWRGDRVNSRVFAAGGGGLWGV